MDRPLGPHRFSRRSLRPRFEAVERRLLLAVITVDTSADGNNPTANTISLRQAIEISDGLLAGSSLSAAAQAQVSGPLSTPNIINFDIPSSGVPVIQPTSELPAVTASAIIDGTTQPITHQVILNGSAAGDGVNGLTIYAPNCKVSGLSIGLFSGSGIVINGPNATGNRIAGNFIGTDGAGDLGSGNRGSGVTIVNAQNNLIGGESEGAGNVISGNGSSGVNILGQSSSGNMIKGNKIGTDSTGKKRIANVLDGVNITGGSSNSIGGDSPGAGNLISGNRNGIILNFSGPNNLIAGNTIGTDLTRTESLSNDANGILIFDSPSSIVGAPTDASHNLISGNTAFGIAIQGPLSVDNTVMGNYIGTKASGSGKGPDAAVGFSLPYLSNLQGGVQIAGAIHNIIGGIEPGDGNVISGNNNVGLIITSTSGGSVPIPSIGNRVEGNFIGPDRSGDNVIGNVGSGVIIDSFSQFNVIGVPGAGNVISGNLGSGITFQQNASKNTVQGNLIGTDKSGSHLPTLGTTALTQGNLQNGITFESFSDDNTVGGTMPGALNVIAGNGDDGINFSSSSTGNVVQGNNIGVGLLGNEPGLGNGINGVSVNNVTGNLIGGTTLGARNIISGNRQTGVFIAGGTTPTQIPGMDAVAGTMVQGNFIGTDALGTHSLPNGQNGVYLFRSPNNLVGGASLPARNVISGNQQSGVAIFDEQASGNTVDRNLIGTDCTGMAPLANSQNGVLLTNAPDNMIGGAGNVISGNGGNGISISGASTKGSYVQGNLIGTNLPGMAALGNEVDGISISGTSGVGIGGTLDGARNVISGNKRNGVSFFNITGSAISGNEIGTDVSGTHALSNGADGVLFDESTDNNIGSYLARAGNVISGNKQAGVEIRGAGSTGNVVQGNTIGPASGGERFVTMPDRSGGDDRGNLEGVLINGASGNLIGGPDQSDRNRISGNSRPNGGGVGVLIENVSQGSNLVQGNYIGTDLAGARPLGNDTGVFINGSVNTTVADNLISGNTGPGNTTANDGNIEIDIANPGASGNVVSGNRIGTDATGKRAIGGPRPALGVLINNTSGNNVIGGRNVISGLTIGVEIYAPQSATNQVPGNIVEGDYIGTNAAGTLARGLGNTVGVYVNGVPDNTIGGTKPGSGNVISGNQIGIYLLSTPAPGKTANGVMLKGNTVAGNLIGLDPTGKKAEGNYIGVFVSNSFDNTIGGTTPAARNVIAGNMTLGGEGSTGVYFFNGAAMNTVEGNFIGTDIRGNPGANLGQGDYGILLYNAPANTYPTSGKSANKILGSGTAPTREFSSSAPGATVPSPVTTKVGAKAVPSGPKSLIRTAERK